jgi:4-amino-4-deoxy-L-arabinose transferase-like glycosyltransferase
MADSIENKGAGERRRYIVSGIGLLCGVGLFLLMSNSGQVRHGVAYGTLLLAGTIGGLFAALNLLVQPPDARSLRDTAFFPLPGEPRWAAPSWTLGAALVAVVAITAVLGGHGLPIGIGVALAILFVSALRRPGLMVFVVASALYLPLLGTFGLWDPWETHYGEVAREMLSRDDWISLWWAQERWFWSKPILIFWSEARFWSASGIPFRPGENPAHVEWVMRLPIFLMALIALLAVYAALARVWNRRAGVLAALVLATTPYYAFLSHQAITDMPFVANMTTAMMLLVLGLVEDPERRARSVRFGPFALSLQHAVIALIVAVALPQILYLASRNITLVPSGFAWHGDIFMFGSAHNSSVVGDTNFGYREERPRFDALLQQPLAQALYWLIGLAAIVWMLRRERRLAQLYMFAFYAFCALAFMAKGIPGFALPGFVALLVLVTTARMAHLFDGKLRVGAGTLVVLVLGMPWFVAMYMRHGPAFTDRLLIHDHLNRLTTGVHGDNASIQYFIWQLGYGLFPWIGLAPLALGSWFLLDDAKSTAGRERRDLLTVMGLWFAVAFTLFSAMTTKFHHYIFPAVPPCAVLLGVLLDQLLPERHAASSPREWLRMAAALLAPVPLVLGVGGLYGDVRGVMPADLGGVSRAVWVLQHPWPMGLCLGLIGVGAGLFAWALRSVHAPEADEPAPPRVAREPAAESSPAEDAAPTSEALKAAPAPAIDGPMPAVDGPAPQPDAAPCSAHAARQASQPSAAGHGVRDAALAVGALAGAIVLAFVARDMAWHVGKPPGSERLIHLFVYNYNRPWPEQFDYRAIMVGFGVVSVAFTIGCGLRAIRKAATLSLVGVSLAFAVFMLDVYMIDLTPHWSQSDLIQRYYKERKGPSEPLVAWQMNWKGESFYTGSRINVFVELDNKKLLEWVGKSKGTPAFFVLEHGRLDRLKRALSPREFKTLTTTRDCNKFVLVKTTL